MKQRPGCFKLSAWGLLVLFLVVFGGLAWDVWQLRALRPPGDRTFDGFIRAGREGTLLIDSAGDRLYWSARQKTIARYSEPVVYEFGRSGALLNWTPGTDDLKGMLLDAPVRRRGAPASVEEARAWLRPK